MTFEAYLIYLAAVGVFFATPPDTSQLLIIVNAARHGLRRSLWTIFGDLSANAVQMTVAAFGLAAIVATSATLFQIVKWVGVAYLAYIGLKLLFARGGGEEGAPPAPPAPLSLFRQGFLTSMSNPFAVVFFGALFPQFIDPASPAGAQLVILGATYLIVDGVILLLWARVGERAALWARDLRGLNRACGALMIAAAGLLAAKDVAPGR